MPRSALPQNYVINSGTLIEDFENAADWTASGGSAEADTENYKLGTQSLKLSVTNGTMTATKTVSLGVIRTTNRIPLWMYLHTEPTTLTQISVVFSSTTDFSRYFTGVYNLNAYHKGWNLLCLHQDDYAGTGGEWWGYSMIRLRITVQSAAGQTAIVSVDNLHRNTEKLPRCIFEFDDARSSAYEYAYPILTAAGLIATTFLNSDNVGISTYMTLPQLQELYNAGWDIGNHTNDHTVLSAVNQATAEEKISLCRDWLIANGFPRAARHLAYPGGTYSDSTLAAVEATGMLTGRAGATGLQSTPVGDLHRLLTRSIAATDTLANTITWVRRVIKHQLTISFCFHELVVAGATGSQWLVADFQSLVDYIRALKLKCVTIDEWYQGLTNPRARSLPLDRTDV